MLLAVPYQQGEYLKDNNSTWKTKFSHAWLYLYRLHSIHYMCILLQSQPLLWPCNLLKSWMKTTHRIVSSLPLIFDLQTKVLTVLQVSLRKWTPTTVPASTTVPLQVWQHWGVTDLLQENFFVHEFPSWMVVTLQTYLKSNTYNSQ